MATITIIAGPNGAGKSTFAEQWLHDGEPTTFLNADEIEKELGNARRAGEEFIRRLNRHVAARDDVAIETTLARLGYRRHIPTWQAEGYEVVLIFIALESPEMAIERVARRVAEGGHDIPENVIRRRLDRGLVLFEEYRQIVDKWLYFHGQDGPPLLISRGTNDR